MNRAENDVAAQYLVRRSVSKAGLGLLIPHVYAWASATTTDATDIKGAGWILSEWRGGIDLDSHFPSLSLHGKELVLDQMAAIFKAIQTVTLPEGVTKFGGLAFDSNGHIVSGKAPFRLDEPVDSFLELKVGGLHRSLEAAARSPVIQGWKENGVDIRIQKFLTSGEPEELLADVDGSEKGLIHSDFSMY